MVNTIENLVIITEMYDCTSEGYPMYELTFEGDAEDFGFSDQTDELSDVDAYEIATEISEETGATIRWEGTRPSWA